MTDAKKILFLGLGPITLKIIEKILSSSTQTEILVCSKQDELLLEFANSEQIRFVEREDLQNLSSLDYIINSWRYVDSIDLNDKMCVLERLSNSRSSNVTFINFSSVAVYGDTDAPAYESSRTVPINSYGINKLKIELLLQNGTFHSVINLRLSNVFGDHRFRDFINEAISALFYKKDLIAVEPEEIKRDFIPIELVVDFIVDVIFSPTLKTDPFLNINISSGVSFTLKELMDIISDCLSEDIEFRIAPRKKEEIKTSLIANNLMRELFSLDDYSVEKCIERYSKAYFDYLRSC